MPLPQNRIYTIDDIYELPDGKRAELIDGRIYYMAPPKTVHQRLISKLNQKIANYIDSKKGACEVIPAPFAVFLYEDDKNYVEPDISVICDKSKLNERGLNGAPDWILEIVSPSNPHMDYNIKLFKYRTAGVREYWIINPATRTINVYDFERECGSNQYSFDEPVHGRIFEDLIITISEFDI